MNLTLSLINNTTNPNLHTSKPVFAVSFSANNKVNDNFKKSNINTSSPKNKSYIHLPAILKADKLGADEKTKAEIKEAKLRILEQISSQLEQKQTYIWNLEKLSALKDEDFKRAIYLLTSEQVINTQTPVLIDTIIEATKLDKNKWKLLKDQCIKLLQIPHSSLTSVEILNGLDTATCKTLLEMVKTQNIESYDTCTPKLDTLQNSIDDNSADDHDDETTNDLNTVDYYDELTRAQQDFFDDFESFYIDKNELKKDSHRPYHVLARAYKLILNNRKYYNLINKKYFSKIFDMDSKTYKKLISKEYKSLEEFEKTILILCAKKQNDGSIMSAENLYNLYLQLPQNSEKLEPEEFYPMFSKIDENSIKILSKLNPEILKICKSNPGILDNVFNVERFNKFYDLVLKSVYKEEKIDEGYMYALKRLSNILDEGTFQHVLDNFQLESIAVDIDLATNESEAKKIENELLTYTNQNEKIKKLKIYLHAMWFSTQANEKLFWIIKNFFDEKQQLDCAKKILSQNDKSFDDKVEELIKYYNVPIERYDKWRDFFAKHSQSPLFRHNLSQGKQINILNTKLNSLLHNLQIPEEIKRKKIKELESIKNKSNENQPEFTHKMQKLLSEFLTKESEYTSPMKKQENILLDIFLRKLFPYTDIDKEEIERKLLNLNFDKKYKHHLLESLIYDKLGELVKNINLNEKFEQTRDKLDEFKTKKLFEAQGWNYEAWAHNNRNLKINLTTQISQEDALNSINEMFAYCITADTFLEQYRDIFRQLEKAILEPEYKIKNGKIYSKNDTLATYPDLINIIKKFDEYTDNEKNPSIKETLIKFKNTELKNVVKKLKNINKYDNKPCTYTVRFTDPNNIGRNIFTGNHVGCCHSVGGLYEEFATQNLINPGIRIMEIVDSNGDSYGNSLCYMTIIDNEYPALIIDSFECKPPLCFSKEVPKTLKKLGEQMLKNMNCSPKGKVLFGVNFCNLDFPSTNEIQPNKGLTLIDSLANKTDYRDALGGYFETEYIQEINPITKNKLLELTQET